MHNTHTRKILSSIFVLLVLLSSCEGQPIEERRSLCVASWNMQNMFDAELDGNEYDEYKPASGWSAQQYNVRLTKARTVLGYLPKADDYILVLNEIEGPNVVEDLVLSHEMKNMGLRYYACAGNPEGAIQSAVVSSCPIVSANVHAVSGGGRPVLEVRLDSDKGPVFVLAVHLKSNIGGVSETASLRYGTATVVASVARTIEQDNPGCLIMVCGDFNEECWDGNGMGPTGSGSPLRVSGSFGRGQWYCFWMDPERSIWPNGSYWHEGNWKCFDNVLVSSAGRDGAGLELIDAGVVFEGVIRTADSKPFAWNRNLLTGVSDHLPVWAVFD